MTERGLLIPREELDRLGDIVFEQTGDQVIIRPRSMVEATRGIVPPDGKLADELLSHIELDGIWQDHGPQAC